MSETRAETTRDGDGPGGLWRQLRGGGHRAGFTMLEVLIAVVIVVIGLVGVMAMQIVSIQANATARDTSEATVLAEHFSALLQQDASAWTEANDLSDTTFLNVANTAADTWTLAFDEEVNAMGIGESVLQAPEKGRARFCVAYKLDWAVTNEAVSGFVRVFWQPPGGERRVVDCTTGADSISLDDLDASDTGYGVHMVTFPVTVRRIHVD